MKRFILICLAATSFAIVSTPLFAAPPAAPAPTPTQETAAVSTLTNINTASVTEIEKLPGIGKKTAEAIVAYRTEKGKFKVAKDLLKVKGIGPKTFEKIKNQVSVE